MPLYLHEKGINSQLHPELWWLLHCGSLNGSSDTQAAEYQNSSVSWSYHTLENDTRHHIQPKIKLVVVFSILKNWFFSFSIYRFKITSALMQKKAHLIIHRSQFVLPVESGPLSKGMKDSWYRREEEETKRVWIYSPLPGKTWKLGVLSSNVHSFRDGRDGKCFFHLITLWML